MKKFDEKRIKGMDGKLFEKKKKEKKKVAKMCIFSPLI